MKIISKSIHVEGGKRQHEHILGDGGYMTGCEGSYTTLCIRHNERTIFQRVNFTIHILKNSGKKKTLSQLCFKENEEGMEDNLQENNYFFSDFVRRLHQYD